MVAAVLLFRTLTYGVQIPLGAFTYVIWRRKQDWRKEPPSRMHGAGEEAATTAS